MNIWTKVGLLLVAVVVVFQNVNPALTKFLLRPRNAGSARVNPKWMLLLLLPKQETHNSTPPPHDCRWWWRQSSLHRSMCEYKNGSAVRVSKKGGVYVTEKKSISGSDPGRCQGRFKNTKYVANESTMISHKSLNWYFQCLFINTLTIPIVQTNFVYRQMG